MKIISVTGAESSIGKTYVVCSLLKFLPGWAALKITRCFDGRCPRGKNCSVCNSLDREFLLEEDSLIINQKNTDTERMQQAGAGKVIWLKTKKESLNKAIDISLGYLADFPGLIIEGNSYLEAHSADLSIMIIRDIMKLKPSAMHIKDRIDIFLIRKNNKDNYELNKNIFIDKDCIFLPENDEKLMYDNSNINFSWVNNIIERLKIVKR
ncbi:MAG: hypothetical protein HY934_07500 [Candidatus Firestonebacteria bacterium]|nr:hypothetical protein [Candidatus Firestonebacteria bacterium]